MLLPTSSLWHTCWEPPPGGSARCAASGEVAGVPGRLQCPAGTISQCMLLCRGLQQPLEQHARAALLRQADRSAQAPVAVYQYPWLGCVVL